MALGCGWICLRQIAFVPNACGQIARATDGCVLSPRSGHRNPAGFACGKLRSFRTLAGRLPALRMAASFYPGYVTGTRLDLPAANCVRTERLRADCPRYGWLRPFTPVRSSEPGWICLRQIAFVPNACGQIARATDGCVLSPRSRRRNPAGFACGKLRSFRTPGRAPLGGSASPTRTGERGQAVLVPTGLCSQPFLSLGKESADPIWADGFFFARFRFFRRTCLGARVYFG